MGLEFHRTDGSLGSPCLRIEGWGQTPFHLRACTCGEPLLVRHPSPVLHPLCPRCASKASAGGEATLFTREGRA